MSRRQTVQLRTASFFLCPRVQIALQMPAEPAEVVPLIELDPRTGSYIACESTLSWIASHPRPFGVVACAGKYRTGKSFLLNQLTESNPGFGVGETVQACTKGLWVRRQFFRVNDQMDVLFVDTEGIDALDASDDTDVRIFTLALLLSSCFLYNSVGHIDEAALSTLALMTRVTESIQRTSESADDVRRQMPSFFWVLRDFSLRLESKEGKTLEPNEYLEESLVGGEGERAATRKAIVQFFDARHLCTLPRPTKAEGGAQNINGKPWLLNASFHEGVVNLKQSIFSVLKPVHTSGNVALTGSMYAQLCRHMAAHGKSQLPVLRDTWSLMASVHARDLKDSLLLRIQGDVEEWGTDEASVLARRGEELVSAALVEFDSDSLPPVDGELRGMLERQAREACDARIRIIGRNLDDIVKAAVGALDAVVDTTPRSLVEAEVRARETMVNEHGKAVLLHWQYAVGNRCFAKWIPRIVRGLDREAEQSATGQQHALRDLQSKVNELEQERPDIEAAHAAAICELTASLEASREDVRCEAAQVEQVRSDLVEVRLQNATLQTALRVQAERFEAEVKPVESTDETAELALSEARTALEDECHSNRVLTERLSHLEGEITTTKKALEAADEREIQLTASWTQGLERVRREAESNKTQLEARMLVLQREKDASDEELYTTGVQLSNLRAEMDRVVEDRDRTERQSRSMLERSRETCEQAQQRVVDMHKSTLDDLRLRDERVREMQNNFSRELTETKAKETEAVREVEMKTHELSGLKRRVSALEAAEGDCKRLRSELQTAEARAARDDTERQHTTQRVRSLTSETDELRQKNLKLENEVAVLRAELQLDAARKEIHHASN